MSDPLNIAAGVIGIAATGFAVAQGLYQIADGIGSAGQEVRAHAGEIDAFSKLLKRVRAELLRPSNTCFEEQSLVKDIVDICERVLLPLNLLQATLKPLLIQFSRSSKKLRQLGLRIHWLFKSKNKLLFYRSILKGQHRVLDTTLELMILQASRDESPQHVYILQLSLEHSMSAVSQSLNETGAKENSIGWHQNQSNHQVSSSLRLMHSNEPNPSEVEDKGGQQAIAYQGYESSEHYQDIILDPNEPRMDLAITSKENRSTDTLSDNDLRKIDEQAEQDLDPDSGATAREVWEDTRAVSRKVLRLAARVLTSSRESTTKSEQVASNLTRDEPPSAQDPFYNTSRPTPPPLEVFHYEKLPSRRSLRLINLYLGSPDNPQVDCELRVVEASRDTAIRGSLGADYEVLSFCEELSLNGRTPQPTAYSYINIRFGGRIRSKKVPLVLLEALRTLRRSREDRWFWIDAICINENNLGEKNMRAEIMPMVYSQAKSLCVWLGAGDLATSMAFKFIQSEMLQLQDFDHLCDTENASQKWRAVSDLFQRPWFSRRWAVQEIALAREVTIYCGMDQMHWTDFVVAVEFCLEVEMVTHRLSEVMKKDPRIHKIPDWFEYVSALGASLLVKATRNLFHVYGGKEEAASVEGNDATTQPKRIQEPLLSLEYLVSSLSIFDIPLEHDTIYSLLAISKDITPSASQPVLHLEGTTNVTDRKDPLLRKKGETSELMRILEEFALRKQYTVAYESPYVDICKTFIQFCIGQSDPTRALDVICRPWASGNKDRRSTAERNWYYAKHGLPHGANMKLPTWVPQLSDAPYAMDSQSGTYLSKMERKNADTLVGLPVPHQRNYNASRTQGIDKAMLWFKKRLEHNVHFSMYVKGFILDQVEQVFPDSKGGAIPQEWIEGVDWLDIEKDEPPDKFWRTLVADRGPEGGNPPVYYSRACKETFMKGRLAGGSVSTSYLIGNGRSSLITQFCHRVQEVVWNRSLIQTIDNIGLASQNVLKGDFVCILYGCSVPVILRRCKNKKSPLELAKEREEDFINTVKEVQRRWKRRFERNRRLRMRRTKRLLLSLLRKKRQGRIVSGPEFLFYLTRKYGMRWRWVVKARIAARLYGTPATLGSDATIVGEEVPATQTPHSVSSPQNLKNQVAQSWDKYFKSWLEDVPKGEDDDRYYYYQFLGEAYVHGMMNGEAIEYRNRQEIRTHLFELR